MPFWPCGPVATNAMERAGQPPHATVVKLLKVTPSILDSSFWSRHAAAAFGLAASLQADLQKRPLMRIYSTENSEEPFSTGRLLENRSQRGLVLFDQTAVSRYRMIAHINLNMADDLEKISKAFQGSSSIFAHK